jgi:hypothetical protein
LQIASAVHEGEREGESEPHGVREGEREGDEGGREGGRDGKGERDFNGEEVGRVPVRESGTGGRLRSGVSRGRVVREWG